jgi:hypothetical protein
MSYTPTAADITQLRRLTGEYPAGTSGYSDTEISDALEARNGDIHAAAYDIWTWKAAAASALIDWAADGGDYKQAVLYDRYKQNALDEWRKSSFCTMIVDPELKPAEG